MFSKMEVTSQLTQPAATCQGSGWALASWEPLAGRVVVEQVYDHQGNIGNGTVPLLVLHMWEHAYYLQYRNVKTNWVNAFWEVVNWEDVAQRFNSVRTVFSCRRSVRSDVILARRPRR